jgi:NADH-quinone oxidoreductase subunit F
MGSCCAARGAGKVRDALAAAAQAAGVGVNIKTVGCVGMCHQTPLVEVHQPQRPPVIYSRVQPEDAADIVRRHFRPPGAVRRAGGAVSAALQKLLTDEAWSPLDRYALNVRDGQVQAFLAPQVHIATEHCGRLDPLDLDEYIVAGGYEALRRCVLELSPEEIIARVAASGLAGRGGAGYPTGLKWSHVRAATDDAGKYIICNGDEGDPGAFMDRMLLESYPHRVIEGMLIAARAVGAAQGVLYIRAEYPLAVQRIESALKQAAGRGLTGERIFGSDFSISLRIMQGAGAFVFGAECRGCVLRTRRSRAFGAGPRWSTTSRHTPACRGSSAMATTPLPASARLQAAARRCSRLPARYREAAWWRCRWGPRCGRWSSR